MRYRAPSPFSMMSLLQTLLCHLNLHECQYKLRLEVINDDVIIVTKEVVTIGNSDDDNSGHSSSQGDEDYEPTITEDMFTDDNDNDVIVNKDPLSK